MAKVKDTENDKNLYDAMLLDISEAYSVIERAYNILKDAEYDEIDTETMSRLAAQLTMISNWLRNEYAVLAMIDKYNGVREKGEYDG